MARRSPRLLVTLVSTAVAAALCSQLAAAPPPRKKTPSTTKKAANTIERSIPPWTTIVPAAPKPLGATAKGGKKAPPPPKSLTSPLFDTFPALAESKDKKPIMIYFFWPEEDKPSTVQKNCGLFEKRLAAAAQFEKASEPFGRYVCDAKKLGAVDKKLLATYALNTPRLLICDPSGKTVKALTTFPASDKALAKQLEAIKKAADKAVETTEKKSSPKASPKKTAKKKEKVEKGKEGAEQGQDEGQD